MLFATCPAFGTNEPSIAEVPKYDAIFGAVADAPPDTEGSRFPTVILCLRTFDYFLGGFHP